MCIGYSNIKRGLGYKTQRKEFVKRKQPTETMELIRQAHIPKFTFRRILGSQKFLVHVMRKFKRHLKEVQYQIKKKQLQKIWLLKKINHKHTYILLIVSTYIQETHQQPSNNNIIRLF